MLPPQCRQVSVNNILLSFHAVMLVEMMCQQAKADCVAPFFFSSVSSSCFDMIMYDDMSLLLFYMFHSC